MGNSIKEGDNNIDPWSQYGMEAAEPFDDMFFRLGNNAYPEEDGDYDKESEQKDDDIFAQKISNKSLIHCDVHLKVYRINLGSVG